MFSMSALDAFGYYYERRVSDEERLMNSRINMIIVGKHKLICKNLSC